MRQGRRFFLLLCLLPPALGAVYVAVGGPGTVPVYSTPDLANDPAMVISYPGSLTPDGAAAKRAAESVLAEKAPTLIPFPTPCNSQKCPSDPWHTLGQQGTARRVLVAPASRQEILTWYLDRLPSQGWNFQDLGSGLWDGGGWDRVNLARSDARISVTTYSQAHDYFGLAWGYSDDQITRLLASGRPLTVYSVALDACRSCGRLGSHASPPVPRVDLSVSCDQPSMSATIKVSGALTATASEVCRMDSGRPFRALSCDDVTRLWPNVFLTFKFADEAVYWNWGRLRVGGAYTSDARAWDPGVAPYPRPTISGGIVRVHQILRSPDVGSVVVEVAAPCGSFLS